MMLELIDFVDLKNHPIDYHYRQNWIDRVLYVKEFVHYLIVYLVDRGEYHQHFYFDISS